MTDNPETENQETLGDDIPPPEPTTEEEQQSFIFGVAALPFVIGAGVFAYQYVSTPNASINLLINAAGILILGLFVGAVANAFAGEKKAEDTPPEDSSHPVS